jgi:hypothetical protein
MQALAGGEEIPDHAHAREGFQTAAPHRQRFGNRGGRCRAIDDAHRDAVSPQRDGQ